METTRNIFWGLVIKPNKRYETEVQEPFRITKACLEPSTAEGKVSSLFIECDNSEEFIIANLNLKNFNETLDLAFNEGEKICFKVDGPGTVHLTGNLLEREEDGMNSMMDEDSDSDEESEEEAVENDDKLKMANGLESKEGESKKENVESESSDEEESDEEVLDSEEDEEKEKETIEPKTKVVKNPVKAEIESKIVTSQKSPKTPKQDIKAAKKNAKTAGDLKDPQTPKGETNNKMLNELYNKVKDETPKAKTPKKDVKTPKTTMKGGMIMEDLVVGTGTVAKKGNGIGMYYRGWLKSNNKQFDACQSGKPFKFKLGARQVISGWDLGVAGMKEGGKRRLTIPASLGYGSSGAPPDIPSNAILCFDVECKFVKVYGGNNVL